MRNLLAAVAALLLLTAAPSAFALDVDSEVYEITVEAPEPDPEVSGEEEADLEVPEATAAVPSTEDEAGALVLQLVRAVQSKSWPLVVGIVLLLLVYILRERVGLDTKVGPKAVPWVALAFAMASTVGAGLVSGISVAEAVTQGILTGVSAIGGWELLFKHLLGRASEEVEAGE